MLPLPGSLPCIPTSLHHCTLLGSHNRLLALDYGAAPPSCLSLRHCFSVFPPQQGLQRQRNWFCHHMVRFLQTAAGHRKQKSPLESQAINRVSPQLMLATLTQIDHYEQTVLLGGQWQASLRPSIGLSSSDLGTKSISDQ